MPHFLYIPVALHMLTVAAAVIVGLVVLNSPLALLCLFLMPKTPYFELSPGMFEDGSEHDGCGDDEDDSRPMGFTAELKNTK